MDAVFFALCALLGLTALRLTVPDTIRPVIGTCAVILALAALAITVSH